MAIDKSPVTGIIAEDQVFVDFGEHEGKSIMEISETTPDFYSFLAQQREEGNFYIRRLKDKSFRLFVDVSKFN